MIKIIQFLEQNPSLLPLLNEQKLDLVGVTNTEQQAIVEAFNEQLKGGSKIWA